MKKTPKILGVTLTAAMISSIAATAAITAQASAIASRDELAEHSVGIVGSFNGWGTTGSDVVMTGNNGVYTGTVQIDSVTDDMISELESDGTKTGKYGLQFKIRLDESWDSNWGDYEEDVERTDNSQTNLLIPKEDITIGEPLAFVVTFDTTKVHPDADQDNDPSDPTLWPVSYELIDLSLDYKDNDDGTITLTGFKSAYAAQYYAQNNDVFVFPDTVDGKTVTKIGYVNDLSGVDFASLGWNEESDRSFRVLRQIQLPDTIKEIDDGAFFRPKFVDDKLPEGLERIGRGAITHIVVDGKLVMPSTLKYIGESAFYESNFSGSNIDEIVLNEGLEYIGAEAFLFASKSPKEITIPKSVKYIGWDAFGTWAWTESGDVVQRDCHFSIYGGGYVESYISTYQPFHTETAPKGYNYTIIGQIDPEPSQTEEENGLSVSGAIPEGAVFKAVATTTKWLENPLFCYEITLNKGDETVQPDGYITISIPCEYGNGYVVYIDEETGKMENLNSIYVDGKYVFVTDHLSEYGIKFDEEPVKYDDSGKKDDTKEGGSETDNTKTDDTQPDNTQTENTKSDNTKTDNTKTNNSQTVNTQPDNTKTDNTQTDGNPSAIDTTSPSTGDNPFVVFSLVLMASIAALSAVVLGRKRKTN